MPEPVKEFFTFFKTRPVTLSLFGFACFALGALIF